MRKPPLTFLSKECTTAVVFSMVVFAFLPFFMMYALAAQVYLSPPKETPPPLFEKAKIKRVDTKSATRFVYPGEIIVKLRENRMSLKEKKGKKKAQALAVRHKLVIKDWLMQANTIVVSAKEKLSSSDVIAQLKKDPDVVYAEPNFQRSLQKRK